MDSFDEFRNNLNRRPVNTRSSLIESDQQAPRDSRSERQQAYNSSGRPVNLSDFKNDMTSGYFTNNSNKNMSYGPSDSWFQQRAVTPSFPRILQQEQIESRNNSLPIPTFYQENQVHQESEFMPYDDSGRTFNLEEFQANSSNSLQHPSYTNASSIQRLNKSNSKRNRTHIAANSRLTFHHVPCDFLKTHCHEFFQNTQCPPHEYTSSIPRRLLEFGEKEINSNLFEKLIKDFYNPGIIVDSVNGLVDFNKLAFDAVFECGYIPEEMDEQSVPMSLLEAFNMRIQYEEDLRDDFEKHSSFCSNVSKNRNTDASLMGNEQVSYRTHRDELKLASTIDIDLMSKVGHFPETPLTEAINSLLKAEKMNNFDRNVHLAEEAIRSASNGQQESEALKSTCSFKLDLQKNETKTTNPSFETMTIISYIGTTKPNNE